MNGPNSTFGNAQESGTASVSRIHALDAVRGIAAFIVLLGHVVAFQPPDYPMTYFLTQRTPLFFFFNGMAAVTIFFVLSGFVLALPYFNGKTLPYPQFLIRRFCRIYLPFLVTLIAAFALYSLSDHQPIHAISGWENKLWQRDSVSVLEFLGHVFMVGTFDAIYLNQPMWTLIHEMRIALIFPLLILLCRSTEFSMALTGLMLLVLPAMVRFWGDFIFYPFATSNFFSTLLATLDCVPSFLVGILIAKHRFTIQNYFKGLPRGMLAALWVAGLGYFGFNPAYLEHNYLVIMFYGLVSGLLIALTLGSGTANRILQSPVCQWLGRISYSLYLIHWPLRMTLLHAMDQRYPEWAAALATIALSLLAATLLHRWVEVPAMRLGRHLTRGRIAA